MLALYITLDRMMLRETYQKQYDHEHAQRAELSSGVSAPVAAITLVASATAVALLDFSYTVSILAGVFLLFVVATLLSLAVAAYYVFRSLWNYKYEKLASPLQLLAFQEQLASWHESQGQIKEQAIAEAEREASREVIRKLCEATDWNSQINLRRGNFLHMGTTAIAVSIASFLPLACIYAATKALAPEKVNAVRVVNLPTMESTMPNGKPSQGSGTPPTPAAAPSAPPSTPTIAPIKPQVPNNSQFRTNTEIPVPSAVSRPTKK